MSGPGIVLEALDGGLELAPGDVATWRFGVQATNGCVVKGELLIADAPDSWDVRLSRHKIRLAPRDPATAGAVAIRVPDDAIPGHYEVAVEMTHDGGRSQMTFPVHIKARKGLAWGIAIGAGTVAAMGYLGWKFMQR